MMFTYVFQKNVQFRNCGQILGSCLQHFKEVTYRLLKFSTHAEQDPKIFVIKVVELRRLTKSVQIITGKFKK